MGGVFSEPQSIYVVDNGENEWIKIQSDIFLNCVKSLLQSKVQNLFL